MDSNPAAGPRTGLRARLPKPVPLARSHKPVSQTLHDVAAALPQGSVSLRDLLERVGEQGMLLFCAILALPFMFPLPLPGVSVVFGLIIALIGVGLALHRIPWLPRWLLERRIAAEKLRSLLERGARFFARLERWIHPRLDLLVESRPCTVINGGLLILLGLLLSLFPPVAPFTNTVPALPILLIALGLLEGDGLFVLLGYAATGLAVAYFVVIALFAADLGRLIWGVVNG